ncbi:MAG: hypothetical protein U0792_07560 [Gemmataceae bacterium]
MRLDSPEFGRTIGGANDGSEFGLELPSEMPKKQPSPDSAPIEWEDQPDETLQFPTDSGVGLKSDSTTYNRRQRSNAETIAWTLT